ncbi:phosphate ABC transporter permease subunit PstC [Aliidiomarina soli]|uniref:Phosphate transport system permease protein n=1 Tax=Aliidiomarina soli TaxID=1928574 RepID=A0A432WE67_9GAMM|nr:phosphate ABC transporter permease subunit PstC [Aliidiomarina soli]RUO31169.1 phosphate ABC transporter permease subunit PstC [Aliidiomarina soli]
MSNLTVIAVLLILMGLAYQLGTTKSSKQASRAARDKTTPPMHSRPHHHGALVAFWTVAPALLLVLLWSWFSPWMINQMLISQLPEPMASFSGSELDAILRRVHNVAGNFVAAGVLADWEMQAAQYYQEMRALSQAIMVAAVSAAAAAGLFLSYRRVNPQLRARNAMERVIKGVLIASSTVAILTTIGIVLSMVGETLRFFQFVSPMDFFFGTTWNPRFSTVGGGDQGEFGLLPLLVGTLLVASVALLVAIPLGLLTAIYLAEYAPSRLRSIAKPVIEILAGIPTIVYGFFALVTVGPFLASLGASVGLDIRATSALTAGVVMGIMIIPFISSLSDDILTQVPKALRDGSLGLGATKSETIRKVVLPAALPGISGAVLLAASRAVGETMIVVLAAGNSPVLTANPFEAVSTMTVTIVNQLTGDNDFSSPQSLVAFALGLTLFAITLVLNIIALLIVRKFREQYD